MTSNPPAEDYKYTRFLNLLSPKETQEKITFALFGLGRAGSIHLKNLLTNTRVNLKYAIEDRPERREEVEKLVGSSAGIQIVGVDQTDALLKDENLQAVLITTPTATHKDIILKALNNGKAVFCEKPLAGTYEDVKMCYMKAREVGVPLYCSFQRRFDPSLNTLAKRVHAGELGKIHVMKSVSRDSPMLPLEYLMVSGGLFTDSMIHDFDLICYTLEAFPTQVFTYATAHIPEVAAINDFDTAFVQMTFPGGTIGNVDFSRFAVYGYDQRVEVFGPKGMLQANNQLALGLTSFTANGVQDPTIYHSYPSRYEDAYKFSLDHFIDVVLGKAEMIVTPTQVLKDSKLAAAAAESARTGLPVDIFYEDI